MSLTSLVTSIGFLVALVLSLSVHEFAHAWAANELGDPTARRLGRLTLNPIAHLDPLGALMLVFMAFQRIGIGWGKPVPVNAYNLKGNPRVSMGLVSAAGPASNLVLATLAAIPLRIAEPALPDLLFVFLQIFVLTNLGLMVFNLMPIPPLDGFSIVLGILSTFRTRWANQWYDTLSKLVPYGPMILILVLVLGWMTRFNPLGVILGSATDAFLGLLGIRGLFW
jgi:Zn-dependent protease